MAVASSLAVLLAAALTVSALGCASAAVNATAAAEVVRLAAADSGVLDAADSVISTVKNNMLLKGITTFNVSALLGDPKVQAAVVVFIEAAEKAAGPSWLYVLPGVAALPKDPSAASQVMTAAASEPGVLAAADKLTAAVQVSALSNGITGWNVKSLAADPNVQAAIIPVLMAAANASGPVWTAVDGSLLASPPAASTLVQTFAQASFPKLPSLFQGRKLKQVILNPGDLLGMPTDYRKAAPSTADAARLNAALGLSGQASDNGYAAEQKAAAAATRSSDPATTSAAMNSFDVTSLNPTQNNMKATQQVYKPALAPAATASLSAYAPAPFDPTAAPEKTAILSQDGSVRTMAPSQTAYASNSDYYSAVYANTAAATGGAAAPAVGQVNIKPANKAPSRLNPGVLQRPGATDTSSANSLTAATPATTASAGSATAAQDILSSLSGNLADSPGVSPAPQGSDFGWLQPTRNSAPLPANSVVAQREAGNVARAPKSSEDSQAVRNFVSQAAFSNGQQQAGSSQQGRRLAEARRSI